MDRHGLAVCGTNDGLWDWNLLTDRVHFSPRWLSMLGCDEHEMSNAPQEWFHRIHPDDLKQVQLDIKACLANGEDEFKSQHRMRHNDGTYRWMLCRGMVTRNGDGQPIRIAGSHTDITVGRVEDHLTGLPNRTLLLDRITRSIALAQRNKDYLYAVIFIDFDRFKSMNERLGSAAGDRLLIAAARRLETALRKVEGVRDYLVAHLREDEFTVLLDGLTDVGEARTIAEGLTREISLPFELDGHEVFITASGGIALSITGYSTPEEVLRDADTAMYRAKSLGRARCEVFDTASLDSVQTHLELEAGLQGALEREEFCVFYQPIVSLTTSRIAGFEALVRWNHPVRGLVSPNEFIPIAERTGLIVPLGQWVLHEACRQVKAWEDELSISKQMWVSVNCSGLQLKQRALPEQIYSVLCDVNLEPNRLILELTESALLENLEAARSLLMQLRVMGIRIALDDFGAGYSSLGYVRELPLDFIKIDRSFMQSVENRADAAEIVRTISALAKQLDLHVIAEGIENAQLLDFVKSLNCEFGQGFFFYRPVAAQRVPALVNAEPGSRQGGESDNESCHESAAVLSAPSGASPAIMKRKGAQFTRRTAGLSIVLGAISLLCIGGIVANLKHRPGPASAYPLQSPLQSTTVPETGKSIQAAEDVPSAPINPKSVLQSAGSESKTRETAGPAAGNRPPASSAPPITPREALVSDFPVLHYHVLRSCKGSLRLTRDALSFISEKDRDNFSLKNGEYSYALANDRLVIKSASKTYRFKSATASSKEENRSLLENMLKRLATSKSMGGKMQAKN